MNLPEPRNETAELIYDAPRMRWSGIYSGRVLIREGQIPDGQILPVFTHQVREAGGVLVGFEREQGEGVERIVLRILRFVYLVDVSVNDREGGHYTFARDIAAVDRVLRALNNSRVLTFQDSDDTTVAVPVSSILDVRITPALPDGADII